MTIDKVQLRALAERVATDRRFCSDEYHRELAAGVAALFAEMQLLEAQRLNHLRLNLSLRKRRKVWVEHCEKAEDQLLDAEQEIDKLRAELAGLRTGYDAQNQVIADYKSGQDRYEQIIEDLKAEGVTLRKALSECIQSLAEEMLSKYHQPPEDMHPSTKRRYDLEMEELAGYRAAMAKEASQ